MKQLLDLDRYPIDDLQSAPGQELVQSCRQALADQGMFNLVGLVRPGAITRCVDDVAPIFATDAFLHKRRHNIYFQDAIPGLDANHPALTLFDTTNRTVCADQFPDSTLCEIYEWPPLADFLAAVMGKSRLHPMADPLARANVLAYGPGEALNWHFDRAEFTTTLMLQAPESGGAFQYRRNLRSDGDPNYDGVARLLTNQDDAIETLQLAPGSLNVFQGKYTAHRVTPVTGGSDRMIAVFSYFEEPDVRFSEAERIGFYGRTGA